MILKNKSTLYSTISGLFLIVFWIYINQTKTQANLSITEILDFTKTNSGPYKDGDYQAASETPWGAVTIEITINNGRWSKLKYLKIPDSPPSQYAASYLADQAMTTQGASVDSVSGATYTSDAFRDDLNQIIQQSKA